MKIRTFFIIFLCLSCEAFPLSFQFLKGPYTLYLGPEVYHLKRERDGGTHQKGVLVGGRFKFERNVCNSIYYGADGYIARGKLRGKSSSGTALSSTMTDSEAEGKIGWKFSRCWKIPVSFTPFLGYGYFRSKNAFRAPSPVFVKFTNKFEYTLFGFLLDTQWPYALSVGIDFKTKYMVEGSSKTADDPFAQNAKLVMSNKAQYEVALPIKKTFICQGKCFCITFSPFYRYRHYGGRENYPFDFKDTQFNIYGANLMFIGSF